MRLDAELVAQADQFVKQDISGKPVLLPHAIEHGECPWLQASHELRPPVYRALPLDLLAAFGAAFFCGADHFAFPRSRSATSFAYPAMSSQESM